MSAQLFTLLSFLPNIIRDIFLENIACLEYLEKKKEHRNFLYRY